MPHEISTETGKRMLQSVTPFYHDEYQLSIFDANGAVMEEVLTAVHKLKNEVLIESATWALPYWESLFLINPTDNQTIEQRRRIVILKMNEYFPVTRQRMESIIETFIESGSVSIDDERGDYIFEIFLKSPGSIDFIGMLTAIEETKPAHLGYKFHIENTNAWFVGGAMMGYEHTTIYPYIEPEKDSEGAAFVGGVMYETENIEMEGDFL